MLRNLLPYLRRRCVAHCSAAAASSHWNEEWAKAGLGAARAGSSDVLNRVMFIQLGFGCDQHGDRSLGSTKAAVRAVRQAIEFNSIPGMVHAVPGGRKNMLIHVKLGVPEEALHVDLDAVAKVFPYGKLLPIDVVPGGLTYGSGRVVTELGDAGTSALQSRPSHPVMCSSTHPSANPLTQTTRPWLRSPA